MKIHLFPYGIYTHWITTLVCLSCCMPDSRLFTVYALVRWLGCKWLPEYFFVVLRTTTSPILRCPWEASRRYLCPGDTPSQRFWHRLVKGRAPNRPVGPILMQIENSYIETISTPSTSDGRGTRLIELPCYVNAPHKTQGDIRWSIQALL